jgi:VWFA-related protein
MRHILAATLLAALAASAPAQVPPQAPAPLGETIEVSVTNVDVVVTNRAGEHVRGLTKNDFDVYEDGKPQPLTNFASFGDAAKPRRRDATAASRDVAAPPQGARAATAADAPVARTIILYIDRMRLAPHKAQPFFKALRQTLHDTVRRGDRVVIAQWTGRLHIRQEMTDDLTIIDAELDALADESTGLPVDGATDTISMWLSQEQFESEVYGSTGGKTFGLPAAAMRGSLGPLFAAREVMMELRAKTDALEALMTSAAAADGKKILLMTTRDFGFHAGAEFFGGNVPLRYDQELNTATLRDRLTTAANASGFVIYPMFPSGIGTADLGDTAEVSGSDHMALLHQDNNLERGVTRQAVDEQLVMNQSSSLNILAEQTGGAIGIGAAETVKLLQRIEEDLDSYYSLGYRSPHAGGERTHRIEVRMKNRAYRVRARHSVTEKSAAARVRDQVVANLFSDRPPGTIGIHAELGAPVKSGSIWSLPLTIHIPIADLTTLPDRDTANGSFSVFAATGATFGTTSDVMTKSQPFAIRNADLSSSSTSHLTYELELTTDGRADSISIGVMDDVTKEYGLMRLPMPEEIVVHNGQ